MTRSEAASFTFYSALTVFLGSFLLAAASQVAIPLPFTTAPFTLQTVAVFLLGVTLGPKRALASVLLYLSEGAMGLPVFSLGHGGWIHLGGLNAGWVLAFAPAAWVVGTVYQRLAGSTTRRLLVACLAGESVIFAIGLLWIAALSGGQTALVLASMPLLITDLLKIALVIGASPVLTKARL